jgi:hypothetical protein
LGFRRRKKKKEKEDMKYSLSSFVIDNAGGGQHMYSFKARYQSFSTNCTPKDTPSRTAVAQPTYLASLLHPVAIKHAFLRLCCM